MNLWLIEHVNDAVDESLYFFGLLEGLETNYQNFIPNLDTVRNCLYNCLIFCIGKIIINTDMILLIA